MVWCFQVACDEDFTWQIGRDVFFDLVDHDKVRSFRIPKLMPFNFFKVQNHGKPFFFSYSVRNNPLFSLLLSNFFFPTHTLMESINDVKSLD